jgi:hypothetical protein
MICCYDIFNRNWVDTRCPLLKSGVLPYELLLNTVYKALTIALHSVNKQQNNE